LAIGPDTGQLRGSDEVLAERSGSVNFDLALEGLGVLIVMSLIFGGIAQAVLWRIATHWLWLIGSVAFFVGGLFASEVVFGKYTVDDIQPIIGGLAFDEALLFGLLFGLPAVLVTWWFTRPARAHGHAPA
jgi:hypothetical protein